MLPGLQSKKLKRNRKEGVGEDLMEPTGALNRANSNEVMDELTKINKEGTTILMVTHDSKVAAKCSRVLYIIDGNIEGEYYNDDEKSDKDRERALNNWLMDLGW